MDFTKFSQNYHLSLPSRDPVAVKMEGNLIFDPKDYLPRESMLKTTLTVLGFASTDLFEVCVSEIKKKKSYIFSHLFYIKLQKEN